jgi:hypothetical protein
MTHHRIIAADWQLKAAQDKRLGAVIVPLVPEPQETINTWVYPSAPIDLFWFKGEEIGERLYKALPYQIGDRLYLAEEWFLENEECRIYLPRSSFKVAEQGLDWQPAETMPEEAAVHSYEVVVVRVVETKDLPIDLLVASALTNVESTYRNDLQDQANFVRQAQCEQKWNREFPDYRWESDPWIVGLKIKEVAQ